MAVEKHVQQHHAPDGIAIAFERGVLSQAQVRDLVRLEADAIGLSFDEAVAMAQRGELPARAATVGLDFLIDLLDD